MEPNLKSFLRDFYPGMLETRPIPHLHLNKTEKGLHKCWDLRSSQKNYFRICFHLLKVTVLACFAIVFSQFHKKSLYPYRHSCKFLLLIICSFEF